MLHDEEDDFHLKLQRTRRESSGGLSFWRTSDDRPAFSSVNVKKTPETSQQQQQQPPPQQQTQQPETSSSSRPKKSLLGGQLQSQNSDHSVSTRQGFTICLVVLCCFVRSSPIPLMLTHTPALARSDNPGVEKRLRAAPPTCRIRSFLSVQYARSQKECHGQGGHQAAQFRPPTQARLFGGSGRNWSHCGRGRRQFSRGHASTTPGL
jgi:hypothetical protein